MSNLTEKMLARLYSYEESPEVMQHEILNILEEAINDVDIVDPTNPFMFLLEASCINTYSNLIKNNVAIRKIYPKLSLNNEELFHHLSDKDFYGIYSTPASVDIKIYLNLEQIKKYGYENGITRKYIIPRDSYFTVGNYDLGIHYPIEITYYINSGAFFIRNLIETGEEHPLYKPKSSVIDYKGIIYNEVKYLELTIPTQQFTINTTYYTIDKTTSFKKLISFSNKFMYLRPWYLDGNVWKEMDVVFNGINYDIVKPTLIVSVMNNEVTFSMPDIYQTIGNVTNVRVDLYTTYGKLDVDLSNIPASDFKVTWRRIDDKDIAGYSTQNMEVYKFMISSLNKVTSLIISSIDWLRGGTNGRTYGQIKTALLSRYRDNTPVLETDIIQSMSVLDYTVVKYLDNITDKIYIASKPLDSYTKNGLNRRATAVLYNYILNTGDALDSEYDYAIIKNVFRATITNDALFTIGNDLGLILVPEATVNIINALTANERTKAINNGNYYYSPFYYVVDYSLSLLKARAYELDRPEIVSQFYISSLTNDNIITTKSSNITFNPITRTYSLVLIAALPPSIDTGADCTVSIKNNAILVAELEIIDIDSVVVNNTITFTIDFTSRLDIDQLNTIDLNFDGTIDSRVLLTQDFTIEYYVHYDLQPSENFGTTESITIEFGTYLEGLYIPIKPLLSNTEYERWEVPVELKYLEDVYSRDSEGNLEYVLDEDNKPVLILLHELGDTVLDVNNNPVYKYNIGDYKLDANGQFIVNNTTSVLEVSIGLFLLSASYRYANEITTSEYRDKINEIVKYYLENEIVANDKMLNERTDLLFKPKGNLGYVRVTTGNDIETIIDNSIKFVVNIYITKAGYQNNELMKQISINTKNIINEAVNRNYLSIYNLSNEIKSGSSNEIFNVDIEKFGPGKNIAIMKLIDDSYSFRIKDKLELVAKDTYDVIDDIDINFIQIDM